MSICGMYQPLPNSRCIRIIEITESSPDGSVRLTLKMSVLNLDDLPQTHEEYAEDDERPSYTAISYTWGPPLYGAEYEEAYSSLHDVAVMVIDEDGVQSTTSIGRNLYEALRHVYDAGEREPLWADALCINQSDLEEKLSQVLLMGDIYSQAKKVIVWLGVDHQDQPTFDHVLSLHGSGLFDSLNAYIEKNGPIDHGQFVIDPPTGTIKIECLDLALSTEALHSLYRFYARRRYLERAWVVQEVALSREAVVLMNGQFIPFKRFSTLVSHLKPADLGGMANLFVDTNRQSQTQGFGNEFRIMDQIATEIKSKGDEGAASALAKIYGPQDANTNYLALIMRYASGVGIERLASDPRDIVYSLIGLANSVFPLEAPPILPDYRLDADEVYTAFTTLLLKALPHRDVLTLVRGRDDSGDFAKRLPSWVPDFRSSDVPFWLRCSALSMEDEFPDLKAGFDDTRFSGLTIRDRELEIFARCCGSIKFHFQPIRKATHPKDYLENMIPEWKAYIALLEACLQLGPAYPSGGSTVEAIFRILACDPSTNQGFRDDLPNFLAAMINEMYITGSENQQVLDLYDEMKILFRKLGDYGCIPPEDELERRLTYLQISKNGRHFTKAILEQVQALFPEFDLYKDGKLGEDALAFDRNMKPRPAMNLDDATVILATEDGYVGRVSKVTLQAGDELWLHCQARVPFILRPTGDGRYNLVSEVFVYGAMYGELIEKGVAKEPRKITIV